MLHSFDQLTLITTVRILQMSSNHAVATSRSKSSNIKTGPIPVTTISARQLPGRVPIKAYVRCARKDRVTRSRGR